MHGFVLTVLLDKNQRIFTAVRSKRKALESSNSVQTNNKNWNKYEGLSYRERIEAGIFKRFSSITEHDKKVELKKRITSVDNGLIERLRAARRISMLRGRNINDLNMAIDDSISNED